MSYAWWHQGCLVWHGRDFNASQPTDLVESVPVAMRYDFRDISIGYACRAWYQQVQPDTSALAHERRVQSWWMTKPSTKPLNIEQWINNIVINDVATYKYCMILHACYHVDMKKSNPSTLGYISNFHFWNYQISKDSKIARTCQDCWPRGDSLTLRCFVRCASKASRCSLGTSGCQKRMSSTWELTKRAWVTNGWSADDPVIWWWSFW